MQIWKLIVVVLVAGTLAACATPQAMTVDAVSAGPASAKFRNAMAVGSVTGGQVMDALTVPTVDNAPFKTALESSLAANGYLARGGNAKYRVDVDIKELKQPLIGLDYDVTSSVTYKVSGGGTSRQYPIVAQGSASLADSPLGADRMRVANERAMKENIKKFLQALQ